MAGRLAHAPLAAHGSGTASRQPSLSREREEGGRGGGRCAEAGRASAAAWQLCLHGRVCIYIGLNFMCASARSYISIGACNVRERARERTRARMRGFRKAHAAGRGVGTPTGAHAGGRGAGREGERASGVRAWPPTPARARRVSYARCLSRVRRRRRPRSRHRGGGRLKLCVRRRRPRSRGGPKARLSALALPYPPPPLSSLCRSTSLQAVLPRP